VHIGGRDDLFQNYIVGLIDDVRIYNRALSASEIAELYRMDTTGIASTTGALFGAMRLLHFLGLPCRYRWARIAVMVRSEP